MNTAHPRRLKWIWNLFRLLLDPGDESPFIPRKADLHNSVSFAAERGDVISLDILLQHRLPSPREGMLLRYFTLGNEIKYAVSTE